MCNKKGSGAPNWVSSVSACCLAIEKSACYTSENTNEHWAANKNAFVPNADEVVFHDLADYGNVRAEYNNDFTTAYCITKELVCNRKSFDDPRLPIHDDKQLKRNTTPKCSIV